MSDSHQSYIASCYVRFTSKCHENPQLDSAVRQIREVGGPGSRLVWTDGGEADGWGGGRTLGWPKVAL